MSPRYSKFFPFALFTADFVLLNMALFISIDVTYGIEAIYRNFIDFGIIANLTWFAASLGAKSYLVHRPLDLKAHLSRLLITLTYYLAGIMGCLWFFKLYQTPRPTFIDFYLFYFIFLMGGHTLLLVTLNYVRKKGYDHKKVLIIGEITQFKRIQELFESHPEYGYDVAAVLAIDELQAIPLKMRNSKFLAINPDEIFICYHSLDESFLKSLIRFSNSYSVKLKLVSQDILEQQFQHVISYKDLNVLHVTSEPTIRPATQVIKRIFDIGFSCGVMIIGSPVFLILYLITKFSSEGPAFFKQQRIGKNSLPFTIYKFRSMRLDAEQSGPRLSSADDPRITKWGRVIRRTRMDELPQFWNVLKGDMSIVGHRPERQHFIDKIVAVNPSYRSLLEMRPGITSIGQVRYGYAENVDQMCERLRYDLLYHPNVSLNHDLSIILRTIKVMVQGKGK